MRSVASQKLDRKQHFVRYCYQFSSYFQDLAMANLVSAFLLTGMMVLVLSSGIQALPFGTSQFERDFQVPAFDGIPEFDEDGHIVRTSPDFDLAQVPVDIDLTKIECQKKDRNGDFIMDLECLLNLKGR